MPSRVAPPADSTPLPAARGRHSPPLVWPIDTGQDAPCYALRIAADQPTRDRVYRLAYEIYAALGYAPSGGSRLVWPYDAEPTTFSALIEDRAGSAVATASLVYARSDALNCDALNTGLPAAGLFPQEVAALRARGRLVAEVCRLCVAPAHRHPRILARLVNALAIHALRVGRADDVVIEVHPCRAGWYRRYLRFVQIGDERPCAGVGGQPTVLLHLDLDAHRQRAADPGDAAPLCSEFCSRAVEDRLMRAMIREARPMTADEARAFGIPHPAAQACGAVAR